MRLPASKAKIIDSKSGKDNMRMRVYLLNMSETNSTSVSAAAIFSAEDGCGRPAPKRKDMMAEVDC